MTTDVLGRQFWAVLVTWLQLFLDFPTVLSLDYVYARFTGVEVNCNNSYIFI